MESMQPDGTEVVDWRVFHFKKLEEKLTEKIPVCLCCILRLNDEHQLFINFNFNSKPFINNNDRKITIKLIYIKLTALQAQQLRQV